MSTRFAPYASEIHVPRLRRCYAAGISAHIFKRGNNRMEIFHSPADYTSFLRFVTQAAAANGMSVNAFAVMHNHFHLIATPSETLSIPRAMKEIGERYARYYNRKYQRVGTPWSGRYTGKPIEDERYWLTCLRYVEQNPVRAGIVLTPDTYQWSSYPAHAWGIWPDWLAPHAVYLALGHTPEQRQLAYRHFCQGSDYV